MLKQTIEYEDYEGNKVIEDFYFNLNKAELMEMQLSTKGGLAEHIQKIVAENDNAQIMALFKNLILKAYGKKSDDGKRFIKNKEITEEFVQSEAYSELFMKLISDENAATAFMNGIIPNELRQNGANPIPISAK